jgi:hypothetical protein
MWLGGSRLAPGKRYPMHEDAGEHLHLFHGPAEPLISVNKDRVIVMARYMRQVSDAVNGCLRNHAPMPAVSRYILRKLAAIVCGER